MRAKDYTEQMCKYEGENITVIVKRLDVARCWNDIYIVLKFEYALKLKATRPRPFSAFLNNCLFIWIAI